MNLLLKNSYIIDGTGSNAYLADIEIENDYIKKIEPNIDSNGKKVIDINGKVVTPGFIDTHSHSDLKVLSEPFLESKIRQGITTEVLGQDGISMAPLPLEFIGPWKKNLAGLDGENNNITWDWITTDGYLNRLKEAKPSINYCYLVPHGNIRMEAMGLSSDTPTETELKKMCDILDRELKSGAIGFSSGLIYTPCNYSATEEIIELCKVVAKHNKVFVVHQRNEADDILNSMEEIFTVARESGVRIHFSHFKVCGIKNRNKISKIIELLDRAKEENIVLTFDQYPYEAGSTMLSVVIPHWAHEGGTDKLIERLKVKSNREKIKKDIIEGIKGWDNFIDFAGFDNIFITSVQSKKNEILIGKSIKEIADYLNKNEFDVIFDLLVEENNSVGMYDNFGLEEDIIHFLKRVEQNVCTDGLLSGKPHPRVYGSFPKVIRRFVRELKAITLEEAINKMTHKAAIAMNIRDRGLIKEGMKADLVIFDKDIISDTATFINPIQYPIGIEYVIVNGKIIVENNNNNSVASGEIIRF